MHARGEVLGSLEVDTNGTASGKNPCSTSTSFDEACRSSVPNTYLDEEATMSQQMMPMPSMWTSALG